MSFLQDRSNTETIPETYTSGKKYSRRSVVIGAAAVGVGLAGGLASCLFGGNKKAERPEDVVAEPTTTNQGGRGGGEALAREADIRLRVTNHPATRKLVADALGVLEESITPESAAIVAPIINGFGSIAWKNRDNSKLLSVTYNPRSVAGKDSLSTAMRNAERFPQSYEQITVDGAVAAYYLKGSATAEVFTQDFELGVALFDTSPKTGIVAENAKLSTIGIASSLTQGYLGN